MDTFAEFERVKQEWAKLSAPPDVFARRCPCNTVALKHGFQICVFFRAVTDPQSRAVPPALAHTEPFCSLSQGTMNSFFSNHRNSRDQYLLQVPYLSPDVTHLTAVTHASGACVLRPLAAPAAAPVADSSPYDAVALPSWVTSGTHFHLENAAKQPLMANEADCSYCKK
jgi:hypothetical protein